MNVQDKVVLVTGASRGIGAASAAELARAGARVILAARDGAALAAQVEAIRAAGGPIGRSRGRGAQQTDVRAEALTVDVTSDESVAAGVAEALRRHGRIDVLVNNAGSGGPVGLWLDEDAAIMRGLMDVHVFGMERMTRAVLPGMLARRAGTIVNFASAIAWAAMPGAAGYCAAKAAVVAFTEALRGEIGGSGVDVLLFAPGHTRTDGAFPLKVPMQEPAEAARNLVASIVGRRRTFVSGMSNRSLVWLKRLWPSFAERVITSVGLDAVATARQLPAPRG